MSNNYQAIDRRLVHKRSLAEVLVISMEQAAEHQWVCQVQVPRGHSSVKGTPGIVPTIAAVEVVRQAGLVVSHLGYGVPMDWAFTIQDVGALWHPDTSPTFPTHDPFETRVTINVEGVTMRRGMVSGMDMTLELGEYGVGIAKHRTLAPKDYKMMRRNAPPKGTIAPRTDTTSLLIPTFLNGILRAQLGWNEPANPFVFDHPVDHIPGMLFADAAIDAHAALGQGVDRGVRMNCASFAELDEPVHMVAERNDSDTTVLFTQKGQQFADVTVYG